jgi:hypothetical protein
MDMDNVLTQYPAGPGEEIIMDGRKWVSAYWAGSAPSTLVDGTPFVLSFNYLYGLLLLVPATTAVYQQVGGLHKSRTDAGYVWVQIEGEDDDVLVSGDTVNVTAGLFLEVLNTGTYLVADGATRTVYSVAMACEAEDTTTVNMSVRWLGGRANIAAT